VLIMPQKPLDDADELGQSLPVPGMRTVALTNPARIPTSVIRSSIGISRWENQLPPQPRLRRWITAKDGTHYEMCGNFVHPTWTLFDVKWGDTH
jgi:hypothetical protein